jgi:hypothetical protein
MALFEAKLREHLLAEKIPALRIAELLGVSAPFVCLALQSLKRFSPKKRLVIVEKFPHMAQYLNPLDKINGKD